MPHPRASSSRVSRRRFLAGVGAAASVATFGRAPAVIGTSGSNARSNAGARADEDARGMLRWRSSRP